VGALAVNDGPGFRAEHLPFGGVKNSGLGREGVKYAIEEMSFIKTLIL
jgi:acyl-CoA reductase-like NAD-dependent aldehyde dehydrogenase